VSDPAFDDEHRAHLASAMRSFLFANRRDGSLTGWPMTPLWRDDAYVYFNTYRSSAKARMLVRDARVGLLVLHGDRALVVTGDAQMVDQAEAAPMFPSMVRTDGFVSPDQAARTVQRLVEGKRCLFRIVTRSIRWER
jgi:hypothetical protein